MNSLLLTLVLAASPVVVTAHGVSVTVPDGWTASKDGTTFIFSAKGKDAQLRIDLFEKENATEPQDCVDQLIGKLASAEKAADSYSGATVDGKPAAIQIGLADDKKHTQKRVIGCDGKHYFLIDWIELATVAPKYDKVYAALLAGIHYAKK